MKKWLAAVLCLALLVLPACSAAKTDKNLHGTWKKRIGLTEQDYTEITFRSNGTAKLVSSFYSFGSAERVESECRYTAEKGKLSLGRQGELGYLGEYTYRLGLTSSGVQVLELTQASGMEYSTMSGLYYGQ